MLKYFSKIALDILPSVAATIIGAYIVNHYINAKPAPDSPAAAAVSSVNPKKGAKPAETSSDIANIPEAGVRAKGISEKAISEKAAAEKAASEKGVVEKSAAEKPTEKPTDKPADTASIPAETKRHPREKTIAKTVPAPVQQPSAPVVQPAVATPNVAAPNATPPVEAAVVPDERLNANEIARATLERLRNANESLPHPQEPARAQEPPRVASAPSAQAPSVRPLPPPIMISTPGNDRFDAAPGSTQNKPPYGAATPGDDPSRPTPPAEIPVAPPLDLRAEAAEQPAREHTNVAEDVFSAAKSMFHAVLPKRSD
jgi:hypothetical protein